MCLLGNSGKMLIPVPQKDTEKIIIQNLREKGNGLSGDNSDNDKSKMHKYLNDSVDSYKFS